MRSTMTMKKQSFVILFLGHKLYMLPQDIKNAYVFFLIFQVTQVQIHVDRQIV
jgi:hypothetical protein